MDNINIVINHLQSLGFTQSTSKSLTNSYVFKLRNSADNNNVSIYQAQDKNYVLSTASNTVANIIGFDRTGTMLLDKYIRFKIGIKPVQENIYIESDIKKESFVFAPFTGRTGAKALQYIYKKIGLENPTQAQTEKLLALLSNLEVKAIKRRTLENSKGIFAFDNSTSKYNDFGYCAAIEKGYAVVRTNYNIQTKQQEVVKRQSIQENFKPCIIGLNNLRTEAKAVLLVEGLNDCIAGNYLLNNQGIYFVSINLATKAPNIELLEAVKNKAPKASLIALGDNDNTGYEFATKIMPIHGYKPLLWNDFCNTSLVRKYSFNLNEKTDICDILQFINMNLQALPKQEKVLIINELLEWINKAC